MSAALKSGAPARARRSPGKRRADLVAFDLVLAQLRATANRWFTELGDPKQNASDCFRINHALLAVRSTAVGIATVMRETHDWLDDQRLVIIHRFDSLESEIENAIILSSDRAYSLLRIEFSRERK